MTYNQVYLQRPLRGAFSARLPFSGFALTHNDVGDTGEFAASQLLQLPRTTFLTRNNWLYDGRLARQSVRRSLAYIPREIRKQELGRVDQDDMENYTPWPLCILIKAEDDSESHWAVNFNTAVPSCVIGDILILTDKDHMCTFPTLCSSKRLLTQSQCRMYNYCSAVCRLTHVVKQCGHRKYSVPMEYLSRQRPIPGLAVAPNVASHPD